MFVITGVRLLGDSTTIILDKVDVLLYAHVI